MSRSYRKEKEILAAMPDGNAKELMAMLVHDHEKMLNFAYSTHSSMMAMGELLKMRALKGDHMMLGLALIDIECDELIGAGRGIPVAAARAAHGRVRNDPGMVKSRSNRESGVVPGTKEGKA